VQDWGGLLGLTLPMEMPERFSGLLNPDLAVGRLLGRSCPHLTPAEAAALSRRAREWFRTKWVGRTFMAVGMKDPVLGPPAMRTMAKMIRNCPPPHEVEEGGHFLQEWGAEVARKALEVL
jgi:haloalkane dehalogenase